MFKVNSFLTLLMISLFTMCSPVEEKQNNTITKQEVENLILSYLSVLKSGDAEAIKKFWSDKSVKRNGFEVMHLWIRGLIHISEWKSFLDSTQYDYRINEFSEKDGYCVVNGEWFKPDDSATHPMPFYLMREDDRWLLINPIDVLTKDWNRYETDNMVFIYPKSINIEHHIREVRLLDNQFLEMCKAMEFSFDHKVEYFKASSPEECGTLLTQPPFNGLAAATYQDSIGWFQIAVSTTFYNPHEVMHVVALSSGVPYSNSFFSEGLAVAFGGTTFQTSEFAHNYSKISLNRPDYIPIRKLITMAGNDFVQLSYITYQESGSFIRYLIDVYGIGKLKELISHFELTDDLDDPAMRVYNVTLHDLENNWKEYLRGIELPQVGFSIPDHAELIFSMTDPENDDEGDGDYQYPSNEKYVKGCFDLTKFEVFKVRDSVYFRISLQKVIEPVSNRPGGARFIPMAVVAINKGDENERQLYKYTNEVKLMEGYDLKINVGFGINISNSLGKIFLSTGDLYYEMTDPKSNTLTFSIPIELIGKPDDQWKYFVGVGLTDERTFNFSGLIPAFKSVRGLISGGNYDHSNPAFIDILLPREMDQSNILSDYDLENGKLVTIKMVSNSSEDL